MFRKRNFKATTIPTKSWDYLESSIDDNPEMLSLIQHIRTSNLADRLFAIISLDKLVISIYNPLEMDRESLHVKFDVSLEKWNFTYYSIPFKEPEFIRTYERNAGLQKFDSFIKMKNW